MKKKAKKKKKKTKKKKKIKEKLKRKIRSPKNFHLREKNLKPLMKKFLKML